MKIRVGIIGAQDTVNLIKDVGLEFSNIIEWVPLPYYSTDESIEIVKQNLTFVDAFLFSGIIPYEIVTTNLEVLKPCIYIPRNSSCIYKLIWQIRVSGIVDGNLSIDIVHDQDITETKEILEELDYNKLNIIPLKYNDIISDYEDVINEHYELWKSGKTDFAVTAFYSTYIKLKELGIPVFRITLTKDIIRKTIESLISIVNNKRLKANQVGVIITSIENTKETMATSYENQRLKLKIYNVFLDYAQMFHGCYFTLDAGEHVIFTTRGSILSSTDGYKKLDIINTLKNEVKDLKVSCGIGYGKTSNEAEINGKLGLFKSKENGGDCAFVVDDKGGVRGPIGKDDELEYSYSSDAEVLQTAEDIGISALYVSKLKAIYEHIGKATINSKELAYYLKISERSGRRILKLLCDKGYAEEVGEETPQAKGRPRILYRINI